MLLFTPEICHVTYYFEYYWSSYKIAVPTKTTEIEKSQFYF
jgi:hypothetical protein